MTGNLFSRVFALDDISIRAGGDGRTVTAYAAVFDSPTEIHDQDGHYSEQIGRTAFDKTLQERAGRIGVFYNHARTLSGSPSDLGSVPIGRPLEMRADGRGLLTVSQYNRTDLADQVLEAIRNGDITGQSFTGRFLQSAPRGPYLPSRSGELTLVTRSEIALVEYGPTPIPAYADAAIVGVRSAEDNATAQPERQRESIEIHVHVDPTRTDEAAVTATAARTTTTDGDAPASQPDSTSTEPPQDVTPAADGTGAEPQQGETGAAPEPQTHSATTNRSTRTDTEMTDDRMTVEERTARQSEIRARLSEIDTEFAGAALPEATQTEWDGLNAEHDDHGRAIAATSDRLARLRSLAETTGASERVDNSRSGYGRQAPNVIVKPENIYDLNEVRQAARSIDEVPALMRDRAMRAIEIAQFPGAERREDAQTRSEKLLNTVDTEAGDLARRMLVTGSPLYNRAFGKAVVKQSIAGLTGEESRALSLGVDASGGYAVPFQLDPTVILTSSGVVNPLRQVARVEQIVGKTWEGVTSAGITVSRGAESTEVGDNTPTLAQPSLGTTRVQGFVPFSVEIERSWTEMGAEVTMLLQDAKDTEEATSFALGDGTGNNPFGLFATIAAGSQVAATTAGALTIPVDVDKVVEALPPRFRSRGQWVGNMGTYNRIREAATANASYAGDIWVRLSGGQPPELIGYSAHELSTAPSMPTTGTALVLAFGDFRTGFLIVDRIGMSVELVPHLFGANGRPTGQRGIYAFWSNNSKVLVDNAIRVLKVTAGS